MSSIEFIHYYTEFDRIQDDPASSVFEVYPKVCKDNRGSFTEVMKTFAEWPKDRIPLWFSDLRWLQQINRSTSVPNVCRGLHAQSGIYCQSKFVECVSGLVYDIIVDARPDSKSFGLCKTFNLRSDLANKLFVPKGFLHGFYSPDEDLDHTPIKENIFQYYIGGAPYNHESEIGVSIKCVLPKIIEAIQSDSDLDPSKAEAFHPFLKNKGNIILSEKDENGLNYETWMNTVQTQYQQTKKVWYR